MINWEKKRTQIKRGKTEKNTSNISMPNRRDTKKWRVKSIDLRVQQT